MIRGPRSRAGLIAYPVVPPRAQADRPGRGRRRAGRRAAADGRRRPPLVPKLKITKTSTKVPMTSETKFQTVLRIAGPVREDGELEARVLGHRPVRVVVEEHEERADHRADHLAGDVRHERATSTSPPAMDRVDGEAERDGRVQVGAAERAGDHDAREDREGPRRGDDDPAAGVLDFDFASRTPATTPSPRRIRIIVPKTSAMKMSSCMLSPSGLKEARHSREGRRRVADRTEDPASEHPVGARRSRHSTICSGATLPSCRGHGLWPRDRWARPAHGARRHRCGKVTTRHGEESSGHCPD